MRTQRVGRHPERFVTRGEVIDPLADGGHDARRFMPSGTTASRTPGYRPSALSTSLKFSPVACTSSATCPGPGGGVSLASYRKASKDPARVRPRRHAVDAGVGVPSAAALRIGRREFAVFLESSDVLMSPSEGDLILVTGGADHA